MSRVLNVVIVGAHPDNCEIFTGGMTVLLHQLGHKVVYIVTTNVVFFNFLKGIKECIYI